MRRLLEVGQNSTAEIASVMGFSNFTSMHSLFIFVFSDKVQTQTSTSANKMKKTWRAVVIVYIKILDVASSNKWIRGAMVARLTPDQKVACSIHVGFNSQLFCFFFFYKLFFAGKLTLYLNLD